MTSKQRSYLKGLAMTMDAVLQIGKSSLTPEITKSVEEALNARELIKIHVLKNCADDGKDLAQILAERTHSEVVQVIGKMIVLYKPERSFFHKQCDDRGNPGLFDAPIVRGQRGDTMRRIGILGGTFDPVHNGHLLLGEQAYREYGLDEIWFMPSHVPPHKKDHLITDGAARIRMLELATESIPYFTVSDFEMGREGNTYTAQTLALLKEAYPDIEVYFIIGADSLYQLESWYHPEQVMAQAVLLVSGRTYEDGGVPLEDKVAYFNEKYNADIRILHNPKIDVASADIRKKAAEGRDLSKDMPAAVAEYIRKTGLYLTK